MILESGFFAQCPSIPTSPDTPFSASYPFPNDSLGCGRNAQHCLGKAEQRRLSFLISLE